MATAPNPLRRRRLLANVLIGLSSFGVLVQIFYFLADYALDEPIRGPIKAFADQHFCCTRQLCFRVFMFLVCA